MNEGETTLPDNSEDFNSDGNDSLLESSKVLTEAERGQELSRSEELRLLCDFNLGTHLRKLEEGHPGSDTYTQVSKALLTVIKDGVGLYTVLSDYWELDNQISLNELLSETTVNTLLGSAITEELSNEIERRLDGIYKIDSEKTIDDFAFSCALLPSLFSDERGKIKYLSDEAQSVLSDDSSITSNVTLFEDRFKKITDTRDHAFNVLFASNKGLIYTYTLAVLRDEEKKQHARFKKIDLENNQPNEQKSDSPFPNNLEKIVWDKINAYFVIPDPKKKNWGINIGLIEECSETAVTAFSDSLNAFKYRRGNNQPNEVDHPFIAYYRIGLTRRVNGVLQEGLRSIENPALDWKGNVGTFGRPTSSGPTEVDQKEIELDQKRLLRLNNQEKKINQMRKAGKTLSDIADSLNLPLTSVWNLWQKIEFKLSKDFHDPSAFYKSLYEAVSIHLDEKDWKILYGRYVSGDTYEQIAIDLQNTDASKPWTRRRVRNRFTALDFRLKETYGLL